MTLAFATTFNTRQWMAADYDYLGAKYGIARELMAGVHVNFRSTATSSPPLCGQRTKRFSGL